MIDWIEPFITSKSLSENSRAAYFYDLQQFVTLIDGKVSPEKLALYEHSLAGLKVSAKKRKLSAVNQFLYFLYEQGQLEHFYKLHNQDKLPRAEVVELLDLQVFYQAEPSEGQLIALLILELGLSPAGLSELTCEMIDVSFGVMTLKKDGLVRVLEIPEQLLPRLQAQLETVAYSQGIYLFDNHGKPYSRQWFFNQLKSFVGAQGFAHLSAQALRQQYILRQKEKGRTMTELARLLGLKSPVTLEKYYKNGY